MFRLGDFYELFFEDAVTAARELEITLTSRNKEKGAGHPHVRRAVPRGARATSRRLIQKGYRVAICDQMEDPRFAKKLVKREITRIVTPGTATDAALLRSRENNYLAAVAHERRPRGAGARGYLDRRVPRDGAGFSREPRRPGAAGRARGACSANGSQAAAAPGPGLLAHGSRSLDVQLRSTPTARCAITSTCSRWMAAGWRAAIWP